MNTKSGVLVVACLFIQVGAAQQVSIEVQNVAEAHAEANVSLDQTVVASESTSSEETNALSSQSASQESSSSITTTQAISDGEPKEDAAWWLVSLVDSGFKGIGMMLGALLGAGGAAFWAYSKWLEEHLTDKWYSILELGLANHQFMDAEKTNIYRESFSGDELVKYEIFARICVAYVDHMVNTRPKDLEGVYCGTGKLFVGRHASWVRNNLDSYNQIFRDWFAKQYPE